MALPITIDEIAQTMRRPTIAQLMGGSAPAADTAASVAPAATAAPEAPVWLKSVGRFLPKVAKFGAAAGLVTQGAGMANAAIDTTLGATFENRPERALRILGGADTTGAGGWLGRMLTGTPAPAEPNPMLTPAFNARVAAAGGAGEFSRGFGANPQVTPAPTPAPATSVPADEKAAALLRFNLLQNERDAAVARYQALQPRGYNPTPAWGHALARFNAAQTGMRAQVGERAATATESKANADFMKALSTIGLQSAQAKKATAEAKQAESGGAPLFGESLTSLPDKSGAIPIINKRTGAVTRVVPKVPVNESDIQETMRANKMTRAQVLQRLKDEGKM